MTWSEPQRKNGGLEYSRSERDGENLVSKRGQDLVRNLVDTVHWWLALINTGSSVLWKMFENDVQEA